MGDIKYKDLNGDGAITYDQDRAYLGRGQRPQFNGSVNLNASWKGLEFDILFVGAAGLRRFADGYLYQLE